MLLLLLPLISYGAGNFGIDTAPESRLAIEKTARAFIVSKIQREYPHHIIEINDLDPRIKLSACDTPLEAFLAPGSYLPGNATIGIRCPGRKSWTIYVPASVKAISMVVTANRPLLRNTAITQGDIRLEEREITAQMGEAYILDPKLALGKFVKRPLPIATPLTLDMLSTPLFIKRGQQVIILARDEGVEVKMAGTALMDGAEGQIIRVVNALSKRTVEGQVIEPGTIRVNL